MFGYFEVHVGPFWGCQGLSWAIWRVLLNSLLFLKLNGKDFPLGLDFGPCWGSCWVRKKSKHQKKSVGNSCLGILGPMLGHFGVVRAYLEPFGAIFEAQRKRFPVGLGFWAMLGLMLDPFGVVSVYFGYQGILNKRTVQDVH